MPMGLLRFTNISIHQNPSEVTVKSPNPHDRRQQTWSDLTTDSSLDSPKWDLLVIGGGITGAGILREAAARGLSAALIEQRDFAWGTSSRSSKMVHGGLRYLSAGQIKLTYACLQERERLLRELPGLVDPMGFIFGHYEGRRPGRRLLKVLMAAYDLMARSWNNRFYPAHEVLLLAPRISQRGLKGGTRFQDAVTDDARLVMRVIQDARQYGALALNYVAAEDPIIERDRVCGVTLRDDLTGSRAEVGAKVVVNATGAWADRMRIRVGGSRAIRPLRGSHLLFPFWRLPTAQALTLFHPRDGRPVFFLPWEGATLVGNTDLDHEGEPDLEARITSKEVDYLLELVQYQFPGLGIGPDDVLSTYAGVRPVIGTGKRNPSREKREQQIWVEKGLISMSGGKLTSFRLMALDVLRRAARIHGSISIEEKGVPHPLETPVSGPALRELDCTIQRRLLGRYGPLADEVIRVAGEKDLTRIPESNVLWAEVRWGAKSEDVVHLEDLLLRRTRLGLLLPEGGARIFPRIKTICREELGWNDERWEQEEENYRALWRRCYSLP